MSSPLPIVPASMDKKFSKLPDTQHITTGMDTRSSLMGPHYAPYVSDTGFSGTLSSSGPGFSSDVHHSSFSLHERCCVMPCFIPQSRYLLPSYHSCLMWIFQPLNRNFQGQNTEVTWSPDSVQDILDCSDNVIVGNNQAQNNSIMLPDDITRQDEWWTDMMNEDWKELLNDTTANESQPKVFAAIDE